eukprot:GILJ01004536.1.p1 GENE.GILJ01004536.1~~GILJ01004536.1.p1  ORF type:complete len:313 (-),score=58.19 GILJ01004536.1:163-1062(-)
MTQTPQELLFAYLREGILRNILKWFLHLITGKCELERLASVDPEPDAGEIEHSLRLSKQLKHVRPILEKTDFDVPAAVRDIASVKRIVSFSRFEVGMALALQQINNVNRAVDVMKGIYSVAYDSNNDEHERKLEELWRALKPDVRRTGGRITREWGEIGFQGDDPATDFRGMGVLGLYNLVYFATQYPGECRQVLADSNHPVHWYSFAICGINVTGWTVRLLQARKLNRFFYETSDPVTTFNELYCLIFDRFNRFWNTSNPSSVMEFGRISELFLAQISDFLPKDRRVWLRTPPTSSSK